MIAIIISFLAGALTATLLLWHPLHERYKTNKNYEQFLDDVDNIMGKQLLYHDVELRARQMMRKIHSYSDAYLRETGYDTTRTRELIPWILNSCDACWEMEELLSYLNHIGLDIELFQKIDNDVMHIRNEEQQARFEAYRRKQERYRKAGIGYFV